MSNNAAIVEISQTANRFRSSIVLQAENKYIDVKSILGLFTTLVSGHAYELHVHGPDAEEAKSGNDGSVREAQPERQSRLGLIRHPDHVRGRLFPDARVGRVPVGSSTLWFDRIRLI